jgi:hypothetical protein
VGGKVFVELGLEFEGGALDIAVQSGDHGANVLAPCGFIVSVEVIPNGGGGLDVAQFELEGKPSGDGGTGKLFEIVEMAVEKVVAVEIAVEKVDFAKAAGGAKRAEEHLFDHLSGRLGPALVFVGAHVFAGRAIDDVVLAVKM